MPSISADLASSRQYCDRHRDRPGVARRLRRDVADLRGCRRRGRHLCASPGNTARGGVPVLVRRGSGVVRREERRPGRRHVQARRQPAGARIARRQCLVHGCAVGARARRRPGDGPRLPAAGEGSGLSRAAIQFRRQHERVRAWPCGRIWDSRSSGPSRALFGTRHEASSTPTSCIAGSTTARRRPTLQGRETMDLLRQRALHEP